MLPVEFGGTGVISFNIGNTGSSPLPYDPVDPNMNMTLVLTLSDGVPDNADPLAALGGTWVNKFSWSYNPAVKTYIATQIADILGDSGGTITVQYKVIQMDLMLTFSQTLIQMDQIIQEMMLSAAIHLPGHTILEMLL
jgi:hypothetical protein